MKKILTLIILTVLITSCGSKEISSIDEIVANGDKEAMESKRSELKQQAKEVSANLEKIENALATSSTGEKIPLVSTFIAEEAVFNHYMEVQGNVVTKQNIVIYPEFNGILTNVYVKEGQRVSKGQQLAKIDDGGLSQQLAQLEAQVSLAKTTYERQKRLWEQKIGSEMQFLQTETSYIAQENTLKQLKVQLEKTIVRAPFSGIIDDVISDQGSVVAASQSPLMRIVNLNNMYIEADVPESHLKNIVKGKKVEVFFPVLGTTVETKVRQVGNFIDQNNRSFKIEVPVPNKNGNIKPNLTSKLKINDYTNSNAILIPQSVISENAEGQQYIYVATEKEDDNKAQIKRIIIETGKTNGDVIEVLKGLKKGDEIIEEGARNVREGQTVKILNIGK